MVLGDLGSERVSLGYLRHYHQHMILTSISMGQSGASFLVEFNLPFTDCPPHPPGQPL